MPNGYWIVRVSVRNAVRYPEYLAAARSAFDKYGARFLVRGGRFDAMEGSSVSAMSSLSLGMAT
jgi:uncharacterized protein (DUF1330 family)